MLFIEVWKEGFQFMQILGPLVMCFDAVIVFVENFSLLLLALAILCNSKQF